MKRPKGLITEAVHDWILTAPAVSNQQKAARLVSCLADRVGGSSQLFHELVQALKEIDPFCGDIVDKLTSLRSTSTFFKTYYDLIQIFRFTQYIKSSQWRGKEAR